MNFTNPAVDVPRLQERGRPRLLLFLVLVTVAGAAIAQQNPSPVVAAAAKTTAAHGPVSAAPSRADGAPKPDARSRSPISQDQALYLVRTTLLTLNDANRSGNYTVLRDLAAPDFQSKNSAADLAQSFSDLRRRNFDLFAAALLAPQFTTQPVLDANGKLRLTGYFPTRPLEISFDLIFQNVNDQWRLFGVAVATPEASKPAESQLDRREAPSQGALYGFRVLSGVVGWRW